MRHANSAGASILWGLLLLCLCALEEVLVTYYILNMDLKQVVYYASERRLLILIVFSGLFFISSGKTIFRIYACFQFIINLFVVSYYSNLTVIPLLSTLLGATQEAWRMRWELFNFIPLDMAGLLLATLLTKFIISHYLYRSFKFPRIRLALMGASLMVIISIHIYVYKMDNISLFSLPALENRMDDVEFQFRLPGHIVAQRMGITGSWFSEWFNGSYKAIDLSSQSPCSDVIGDKLPLAPLSNKIVMVQVESLDYAVINLKWQGREITPNLNRLAASSLLLPIEFRRRVGSANSDYEIFATQQAKLPVIYYFYLPQTAYRDFIVEKINQLGYETTVVSASSRYSFANGQAYEGMNFRNCFFEEEILEAHPDYGQDFYPKINDQSLLAFAASQLDHTDNPQVMFIITMGMHQPCENSDNAFGSDGLFERYLSTANFFDIGLQKFIDSLPDGTLVFIWGDHSSEVNYPVGMNQIPNIPFIVHVKGQVFKPSTENIEALTSLCQVSHYLRKHFTRSYEPNNFQ